MARKRPDPAKTPAALKAVVLTYEKELQQILGEGKDFQAQWGKLSQMPPNENRETASTVWFVQFLQILSRRIDLMEKYEAALREYAQSLERQIADLEKKSGESWREGIEP